MILFDNTVISNFAQACLLSLLHTYCQNQGCTTSEVFSEFDQGFQKGIFGDPVALEWLTEIEERTPAEEVLYHSLCEQLNRGEASCLAIAISRNYNFLSDDRSARKVAFQRKVRISGTIGVLLDLIEMKELTLDEGNQILRTFIQNGYFSSIRQLDELI